MNPYDKDLEPGDLITVTDELVDHLNDLGIDHALDYGDELIVLADDWHRKFPILVANPRQLDWRAWIFRVIAWNARDFWLKQRELADEDEGVVSLLPLEYWNQRYRDLSPGERAILWRKVSSGGFDQLWAILVNSGGPETTN